VTPYQRIFGSGPLLLMLALVLVIGTVRWQGAMIGPRLQWNFAVRLALAGVVFVVGIAIVVWSFQTLTLRRRGRELVTTGPYHYVRHPLYSVMFWGPHLLVFFLTGTWLALLALVLMFVAGHLLIGREEKLMELEFGEAWREYARRTPRFLPRLVVR
jgi:protein-S-isoprenylcysteine O-methyltransferase Ste14